jgi:hypothetical protein
MSGHHGRLFPLIMTAGCLLLSGCQPSSPGPPPSPPASGGHAAGEPTDAQVKAEIVAKGCLLSPDLGTHAGCLSVDGYTFSAINRHGQMCLYTNRIGQVSYPITMVVTATGHFQDGDQPFSIPAEGADPAQSAFMFYYSDYYKGWNYTVAPLSQATTPDSSGRCPPQ